MTPAEERTLAHARAVRARGYCLPPGDSPRDEILDSWVRCGRANLDLALPPAPLIVDASELAQRRERLGKVRRLALARSRR